jgi:tRNA pseudouridine55 synthase
VGHTGTLDKFARGLLIVLAGKALRLSRWFTHCDKEYEGRICFGAETETLDPEGQVIAQAPVPEREKVEQVLKNFTGEIMQAPPAYSAIHIDGKRASALARSGAVIEMKKRPVTIYRLELRKWQSPFADIFVRCSSGTYIRSLARDIAVEAGSRGHLVSLLRTKIAGFSLDMACEGIGGKEQIANSKEGFLRTIDKSVINKLGMPIIEVSPQEAQDIKHGKPFSPQGDQSPVAVFLEETLVAVVENIDGKWTYGCVFND